MYGHIDKMAEEILSIFVTCARQFRPDYLSDSFVKSRVLSAHYRNLTSCLSVLQVLTHPLHTFRTL